jgi:hypothetical protein
MKIHPIEGQYTLLALFIIIKFFYRILKKIYTLKKIPWQKKSFRGGMNLFLKIFLEKPKNRTEQREKGHVPPKVISDDFFGYFVEFIKRWCMGVN